MSNTEASGPSRQFIIQNKNVFLTYPRCPIPADIAGTELHNRLTPLGLNFLCICSELHLDGTPHLHVLAQSNQRMCTRDVRFFDLEGHHPNIQIPRNPKTVLAYITKSPTGEFYWGTFRSRSARQVGRAQPGVHRSDSSASGSNGHGGPGRNSSSSRGRLGTRVDRRRGRTTKDGVMKTLLQTSTSRAEYLNGVKKHFPYEYCVRLQNWEYAANKLFPDPVEQYVSPFPDSAFRCNETITDWLGQNIYQVTPESRPMSLYICGPSRTGKSSWARSLGRHNYYMNGVDFSEYDSEALYNIIDDIPFKYCPAWKCLIGCQKNFQVNPKYMKRRRIKGGIPTIVLTNPDEDWIKQMTPEQLSYFDSNCITYYMYDGDSFISNDPS
nr:replication-associated protein [Sorghum arundinaceum associated virus]